MQATWEPTKRKYHQTKDDKKCSQLEIPEEHRENVQTKFIKTDQSHSSKSVSQESNDANACEDDGKKFAPCSKNYQGNEKLLTNKEDLQNIVNTLQSLGNINPTKNETDSMQEIRAEVLQTIIEKLHLFNCKIIPMKGRLNKKDRKKNDANSTKIRHIIGQLEHLNEEFLTENQSFDKNKVLQSIIQEIKIIKNELRDFSDQGEIQPRPPKPHALPCIGNVIVANNRRELRKHTQGPGCRLVMQNIPYGTSNEALVHFINAHSEGLRLIAPRMRGNDNYFAGTLVAEFSDTDQTEKFEKEMNGFIFEGMTIKIRKESMHTTGNSKFDQ